MFVAMQLALMYGFISGWVRRSFKVLRPKVSLISCSKTFRKIRPDEVVASSVSSNVAMTVHGIASAFMTDTMKVEQMLHPIKCNQEDGYDKNTISSI